MGTYPAESVTLDVIYDGWDHDKLAYMKWTVQFGSSSLSRLSHRIRLVKARVLMDPALSLSQILAEDTDPHSNEPPDTSPDAPVNEPTNEADDELIDDFDVIMLSEIEDKEVEVLDQASAQATQTYAMEAVNVMGQMVAWDGEDPPH